MVSSITARLNEFNAAERISAFAAEQEMLRGEPLYTVYRGEIRPWRLSAEKARLTVTLTVIPYHTYILYSRAKRLARL